MKILIDFDNVVIAKGETIETQAESNNQNWLVDNHTAYPKQDFKLIENVVLPSDFAVGIYKYDNGFVKNVDQIEELKKQGYDNAVADILGV